MSVGVRAVCFDRQVEMDDSIDRDRLRRVFASLSTDAGRAFSRIDERRLSDALYDSALAAWFDASKRDDQVAKHDWYRICSSLLK